MGNKLRVVVVVGVAGVGKSTVLSHARRFLEDDGYVVETLNYGDFMLKYVVEKSICRSRDEIRSLPLNEQRRVQSLVAREMRNYIDLLPGKYPGSDVVVFVDTHAVIKTTTGFWPGLPEYVIKELRPDTIVVVEADPQLVVERQSRDLSRYRKDYSDVGLVKEVMEFIRMFSVASATLVGASVSIVRNEEGRAEEAGRFLAELVKRL
ncbi:MAG: adenylate kinase [Desulfurococcaceae archaeon TW002]